MSKTVKEHFEACKQVSQVIDDANALLTKCKDELHRSRTILELLEPYQHPKLAVPIPYMAWLTDEKSMPPSSLIALAIKRINALLGDRA